MAIDYFIEWVKAEPLAKIIGAKVTDFVWKSIICRFDLLQVSIIDNRHQFLDSKFIEFYQSYGIAQYFTSIGHPLANGKTEVTK